jgi:hypothetical protein
MGFFSISIPRALLGGNYTVLIDGHSAKALQIFTTALKGADGTDPNTSTLSFSYDSTAKSVYILGRHLYRPLAAHLFPDLRALGCKPAPKGIEVSLSAHESSKKRKAGITCLCLLRLVRIHRLLALRLLCPWSYRFSLPSPLRLVSHFQPHFLKRSLGLKDRALRQWARGH